MSVGGHQQGAYLIEIHSLYADVIVQRWANLNIIAEIGADELVQIPAIDGAAFQRDLQIVPRDGDGLGREASFREPHTPTGDQDELRVSPTIDLAADQQWAEEPDERTDPECNRAWRHLNGCKR